MSITEHQLPGGQQPELGTDSVRGTPLTRERSDLPLASGLLVTPRSNRRKRFLILSMAGLAVLAAVLGVSFLGATGSTSVSVSASSSNFVYPVFTGASLPAGTNFVSSLKYTGSGAITSSSSSSTINAATLPNWTPTLNSAGSVTSGGDLALINGTIATNGLVVNMYVTNLADLQQDYSSFAFPVNVYESTCSAGSCSWSAATSVVSSVTYLTNTSGYLSFNLPAGKYYDIAMDSGGSYYTTATTSGDLSPSFYFTAQPY